MKLILIDLKRKGNLLLYFRFNKDAYEISSICLFIDLFVCLVQGMFTPPPIQTLL
jgi:hypothetical protein